MGFQILPGDGISNFPPSVYNVSTISSSNTTDSIISPDAQIGAEVRRWLGPKAENGDLDEAAAYLGQVIQQMRDKGREPDPRLVNAEDFLALMLNVLTDHLMLG